MTPAATPPRQLHTGSGGAGKPQSKGSSLTLLSSGSQQTQRCPFPNKADNSVMCVGKGGAIKAPGSHQSIDVFGLVDERSDLLGVPVEDSLDERRLGRAE